MKAFLTWVSSSEVPGWSPISFSGRCWLQFLHPLCWVFSIHTQQFSTVQSTYAEHGSQVLLDVLVVEHGLQGSLWKIHFKLSLMGKLDKTSTRKNSCQNLPCKLYARGPSLQINIWPKPFSSLDTALSLPIRRSSGSWIKFYVFSSLSKCGLMNIPDSPLSGDRSKGR